MGKFILYAAVAIGALIGAFVLGVGSGLTMKNEKVVPEGYVCQPSASAPATPAGRHG